MRALLAVLTFKAYRDRREAFKRRANYDAIRAQIVKRHKEGFGNVVLSKKYDAKDVSAFRPPMYQTARTVKSEPIICWRKDLMTEEVGPPNPKPLALVDDLETEADAKEPTNA